MGHIVSNPRLCISRRVPQMLLSKAGLPVQVSFEQALAQVLLVQVVGCLDARHGCGRYVLELVALEFAECGLRIPAFVGRSRRLDS